jgi:hypothetical protein
MPNIIIGLLALAFGLWGLSVWWWSVTELLRGLVPLLLLGVGFIALAAGISNIQTTSAKKTKRANKPKVKAKPKSKKEDELSKNKTNEGLDTSTDQPITQKINKDTKAAPIKEPRPVAKAAFKAEVKAA